MLIDRIVLPTINSHQLDEKILNDGQTEDYFFAWLKKHRPDAVCGSDEALSDYGDTRSRYEGSPDILWAASPAEDRMKRRNQKDKKVPLRAKIHVRA